MTYEEQAEAFLQTQTHMVIAVVADDGTPWAVPVTIQARDKFIFEWDSKTTTVHSQAIARNPKVSICVFQKSKDDQPEMGLCGTGQAEILSERDGGFARYRVILQRAWLNGKDHVKRELDVSRAGEPRA